MTALSQIEAYITKLHQRLRFFGTSRGVAASALCALLLTLILTWIGNQYRFASGLIWPFRLCLVRRHYHCCDLRPGKAAFANESAQHGKACRSPCA